MRSEALSKLFTDIDLTIFGLLIFVIFFVLMIFFVFRRSRKGHYEKMSKLPLEENNSKGTPNE